jgi:hypothetical protein
MKIDRPSLYLPPSTAKQIVAHWTGGSYTPSSLDKHHYHFLIDGDGTVTHGEFLIDANDYPVPGEYAAHVRNWNSNTIGLAVCCMYGAKEEPFDPGPYPIKRLQWEALAELTAVLCKRYSIPIGPKTTLLHSEVEQNIGIPQRGKWDINVVPTPGYSFALWTPEQAGGQYRRLVSTNLAAQSGPGSEPEPCLSRADVEKLRADINTVLNELLEKFK